jgi:hypothetical protein
MTTTTAPNPDIPLPAGAEWADGTWEPEAYRIIQGAEQHIDGHDMTLRTIACQLVDGRIDVGDDPPHVVLEGAIWLTAAQARQLARLLVESAEQIDRWVKTAGNGAQTK